VRCSTPIRFGVLFCRKLFNPRVDSGVTTHATEVSIAVVPNTQDIAALAVSLEARFAAGDPDLRHGFLMAGHGLYTWGADLAEARRHIEVLEFLMEVVGTRRGWGS